MSRDNWANHTAYELAFDGMTDLELGLVVAKAMKAWRYIDPFDNTNTSAVEYWRELERLGSLVRKHAVEETLYDLPDIDYLSEMEEESG